MSDGRSRGLPARSVIASTLLGTHPPQMPGRMLVAITTRFGITEGTARVALSRMVENGELVNHGGNYALTGRLLDRQRRQDASRRPQPTDWSGGWHVAVVAGPPSAPKHRQERRARLKSFKLAELREGVWLRPDNLALPAGSVAEDVLSWSATTDSDPVRLAAELWDLEAWATEAADLLDGLTEATSSLDVDDNEGLQSGFMLSATVLRHLVADPELPRELWPPGWPSAELRTAYDSFDAAYRRLLRRFFASYR